jgi:sulfofructose kinase
VSNIKIRKDSSSQFAFSVAEPVNGRRTIFWRRPTGSDLQPAEIDLSLLRQSGVLLTDGIFPDATIEACKIARKAGIPVIVDAGSLRPGMIEILDLSDYFIASETFARAFMPGADIQEVCKAVHARGPLLAAVTLGSQGYAAFCHDSYIAEPAYQVKVIDTTGCGDIFHAGFTYGLLKSWTIPQALKYASWAAAMVSRFAGGRTGIPDPADWPDQRQNPKSKVQSPKSE